MNISNGIKRYVISGVVIALFFLLTMHPALGEGSYREVATMKLPSFCTQISEVYAGNDFAFLKSYGDIYIINISNPENPKFYGNLSDYLPEIKSHRIFTMDVSQNRMYVSMDSIYSFNMSGGKISLTGEIDGSFKGISTNGDFVCAMSGSTPEEFRIEIIDFTSPKHPKKVSEIPKTYNGNYAGGRMAFSGDDLYISYIDGAKTEIIRYSLKNPKKPVATSKISINGMPASPSFSLSFSGEFLSFISSVNGIYYLNVFPKDLGHFNSVEIGYLPLSVTSYGKYVFVQNRNKIDFFLTDGSDIEKQLSIDIGENIAMKSACMNDILFVVSSKSNGGYAFNVIKVEGKLSGNFTLFLIGSMAAIVAIIVVVIKYRKIFWKKRR